MKILYCITGAAFFWSFLADRHKTKKAAIIAMNRFVDIIPAIFFMLLLVSCLPVEATVTALFNLINHVNNAMGVMVAALAGSIIMLPGFIVFPLCGVFAEKGVPYFILSAFTTTMMMVGVVTFPVEKSYLGTKLALVRNMIGFGIALVVATITGLLFGEF
jgi:uncharacterized membrane protein YraQ (UPF0718 family)